MRLGLKLIKVIRRFPDDDACIEYFERVRWPVARTCPLCGSFDVARKADNQLARWNCHGCKSSFNVLSGTVLQKTRVPLQKWFLATILLVNSKKDLTGVELARDLELNRGTARFLARRIRVGLVESCPLVTSMAKADRD